MLFLYYAKVLSYALNLDGKEKDGQYAYLALAPS